MADQAAASLGCRKKPTQWMIFANDSQELIAGASATQESYHCVEKKFDTSVDETFLFP